MIRCRPGRLHLPIGPSESVHPALSPGRGKAPLHRVRPPGLLCGGPCGSCQLDRRLLVLLLRVVHAALVQFQAAATPDYRFSRGCFPQARLLQARIHGLGSRALWGGRAHSRTARGAGLLGLLVCRRSRRPPLPASSRVGRSILHTRRSMRGFLRCGRTMSPCCLLYTSPSPRDS